MLPLTAIAALLRCPRCRSALSETGGSCSDPACGMLFERAGRQPILIDASNSIVYPASSEPAIESRGGPLRRLLDRLGEKNRVAPDVSEKIRAELVARTHGRRPIVLVVGGKSIGSGIDSLYDDPAIDLIGFDVYPSRHTQFVADGHAIPLADASVDAVVIEAVLEPARVVAEIHRVLRADGLVYADTPFLQHVHEGPFDFTRFTESGHRWLFRHFELIESGHVAGVGAGLCWSIAHVARSIVPLRGVNRLVLLATRPLGMLVDRLTSPRHAIDGASSVYFFGRRSETPLAARAMIAHYRGTQAKPIRLPA